MNYRSTLIKLFTFLGGIYFFLEFVLPPTFLGFQFGKYDEQITDGFRVIGSMAFGLGLINLFWIHGARLIYLRKGWINSVALLLGLFGMIAVMSLDWKGNARIAGQVEQITMLRDFATRIKEDAVANREGVPPVRVRNEKLLGALTARLDEIDAALASRKDAGVSSGHAPELLLENTMRDLSQQVSKARAVSSSLAPSLDAPTAIADSELMAVLGQLASGWRQYLTLEYERTGAKLAYRVLFDGLFVSLGSAMFSLLGFYIASAAYRAFRIRSPESALMMVAALFVMLGQIPFGIYLWERFPEVRLWLLSVPSAAARRAIEIGASIAGLVMAFRMWFSIESESFGEKK